MGANTGVLKGLSRPPLVLDTPVLVPTGIPGPPISDFHVVGETALDTLGALWVCTTAGNPGLWTNVAGPNLGAVTPVGGVLVGSMPAPAFAPSVIFDQHIAPAAAIREDKLALGSDSADGVPSRRSLGFGAGQAARGIAIAKRRMTTPNAWYGPEGSIAQILTSGAAPAQYYYPLNASAIIMWFNPLLAERPITIDQLGVYNNVVGSANWSSFRIGIYNDDGNGNPTGAPLVDAAGPTLVTTGARSVAITALTLAPGLYWLAFLVPSAIAAVPQILGLQWSTAFMPNAAVGEAIPYATPASSAALPNPVGTIQYAGQGVTPAIFYHLSAVLP